MKRMTLAVSIAALFATTSVMFGDRDDDPFLRRGERGETVHVLPPAARVRSPHDPDPLFAPPSVGATVYRASYGVGNLRDHGGPEISNAGFWAIFWNSAVANSPASTNNSVNWQTLEAQIDAFIHSFPDNANYDQSKTDDYEIIQQYGSHSTIANTLRQPIAPFGAFVDASHDLQRTPSSFSDSQIQGYLASLFQNSVTTGVQPSASTIYGIYFPAGMRITIGSGGSCSTFCGYHSVFNYNGTPIKYAVFPYLNCSACFLSGLTVGDMLTIVTSHEIREAVTDPGDNGANAWYDQVGYEADDKCAWHHLYQTANGRFWVQPEYSNGGTKTDRNLFMTTYPGAGCVVP